MLRQVKIGPLKVRFSLFKEAYLDIVFGDRPTFTLGAWTRLEHKFGFSVDVENEDHETVDASIHCGRVTFHAEMGASKGLANLLAWGDFRKQLSAWVTTTEPVDYLFVQWNIWTDPTSWSVTMPRWRRCAFSPANTIFGVATHSVENADQRVITVTAWEGDYSANMLRVRERWDRPRWPWNPWYTKNEWIVLFPGGFPIGDGLHKTSLTVQADNAEEAIAKATTRALLLRQETTGDIRWRPGVTAQRPPVGKVLMLHVMHRLGSSYCTTCHGIGVVEKHLEGASIPVLVMCPDECAASKIALEFASGQKDVTAQSVPADDDGDESDCLG